MTGSSRTKSNSGRSARSTTRMHPDAITKSSTGLGKPAAIFPSTIGKVRSDGGGGSLRAASMVCESALYKNTE
ncbi:hypothetical protein D3C85_1741280 [compost metagenome]